VTLTKSQINPLLHNSPADIFGHPILKRQELTEVAGAQVTFYHHHLATAVVVMEYQFLLIHNVKRQHQPSSTDVVVGIAQSIQ
jgi:hypothetical protein